MRNAVTTSLLSILGLSAAGLLAGCPDRTISEVDPLQGRVEYKDIPVNINRNIDILFVIDDSPIDGRQADEPADQLPELHQRPQHDSMAVCPTCTSAS